MLDVVPTTLLLQRGAYSYVRSKKYLLERKTKVTKQGEEEEEEEVESDCSTLYIAINTSSGRARIKTRPLSISQCTKEWSGVEWSGVEWSGVEWSAICIEYNVTNKAK